MKLAMEILSLLAFLLGSPVYLPRLVDAAPTSNTTPAKANSHAAKTALPSTK